MTKLRERMLQDMQLRGFSDRTQECYREFGNRISAAIHAPLTFYKLQAISFVKMLLVALRINCDFECTPKTNSKRSSPASAGSKCWANKLCLNNPL